MLDTYERIARVSELMDLALTMSTGLNEVSRKKVVYWTLATHFLPHVQTFSQLALLGKMGTGKSETLKIISKFARRAKMLSLRGMTLPAIRDALVECELGDCGHRGGGFRLERC